MSTGYKFGDGLKNIENETYDYLFTGIPDYEDLQSFGVTVKKPNSYKEFLDTLIPRLHPALGTITIAFTGSRRNNSRVLPKFLYLSQAMVDAGYFLRDNKYVKKSDSYNAYSSQIINVMTFQKEGTKGIYNLKETKSYSTYGKDCWGPFGREQVIDGEVVGAPIEIPTYCIENFTNPGHIVFDPFAGLGTTLAAASVIKRQFLGYEIRKPIYEAGLRRYASEFAI
jgi:hypothetical protein